MNEIIQKVRDHTVSKQKQLICKLFQITLTEEPSNHVEEPPKILKIFIKANSLCGKIFPRIRDPKRRDYTVSYFAI